MDIITGVERRRQWRLEEKLRIVAEVDLRVPADRDHRFRLIVIIRSGGS
jgi:hypothetical protein